MASMSRTSSASSVQGFSILQPTLGAPLSFLPAVGTKELDVLIDAYLPGPASPQEKRAAVALEFFEYSARTAQNFKYFAVPTTVSSPIGVSPSPVMSEMTYASSSQASTPATPASKTSRSAKRPETTDFSHLPGMRIITVDGQDVTNNVSRGCKTKEQRDHAHLMRILKACDACKKKKIRCDPSHKKRSVSQVESGKSESVKPAKKSKKTASASIATPKSQSTTAFTPAPEVDYQPDMSVSMEDFTTTMAEWDQYFTFNEPIDATLSQGFYDQVPQDFNFFFEPEAQFSPATSGSSAVSPAQPLTPTSSGVMAQADSTFDDSAFTTFAPSDTQEAMLPYLAPGAHGSNYLDFNLFSPPASFIDEEPRKLKAGEKRKAVSSPVVAGLNEPQSICTGVSNDQQDRIHDYSSASLMADVPAGHIGGGQHALGGEVGGSYASAGLQLPFHEDGHNHATTEASPYDGSQSPSGIHSPVASGLTEGRSRTVLRQGRNLRSASTVASASVLPQGVSPSTGSEALVRPTGARAQLTRPLTGTSSVCYLSLVSLDGRELTFKKVLRVLDGQQPLSQLQTPSTPAVLPSPSPSTAAGSSRPVPLDHRGPTDLPTAGLTGLPTAGLTVLRTGVPTGVLTSADRLRTSAFQGPQVPVVNNVLPDATSIQTTTAASATGPARGDSSFLQLAVDRTVVNVQNLSRSTGLGSVSSHGLNTRRSLSRSQLPEKVESPLAAVLSLTTPVQQLLVGSTTIPLSVLAQLAVFGLVSLLLIVAVTSDLQPQQAHLQLQYPVFASIPFSTMMFSFFFLPAWTSQQHNQSSSSKAAGVLSSLRNLLSGSSSSSTAAPSPRQRQRVNNWSSPMTTTRRVMACF